MIHMTEAGTGSFGATTPSVSTRPLPSAPEQQDFIESDPIAQYSTASKSSTTISSKIKSSVSHAFQGKSKKRKFKRPSTSQNVEDECCCNVLPAMVAGLTLMGWVVGAVVTLPYIYSQNMTALVIHEVIGAFEVTMLLWNYFKCMKTNPGLVQADWHEHLTEEEKESVLNLELNKEGKPRYCHTCGTYKPPRAHHSSFQNKCVLKMDHYCIWVNNVVGMFNHKFFYLFLFYAVMAMSHYYIVAISGFVKFAQDPEGFNPLVFILLLVCSVFLCPMGLMVFAFLMYQTYLICTNQTSIEFHNNSEVSSKLKFKLKKRIDLKHIYQMGIVDNIKNFLGSNPMLWLLPTKFEGSDGIHFKTIAMSEVKKIQTYTVEAAIYSSGEEDNGDHYGSGDEESAV